MLMKLVHVTACKHVPDLVDDNEHFPGGDSYFLCAINSFVHVVMYAAPLQLRLVRVFNGTYFLPGMQYIDGCGIHGLLLSEEADVE